MDRYKFRGKRLDNGEWVEGSLLRLWKTEVVPKDYKSTEDYEFHEVISYFIVKETHTDYEFDDDMRFEVDPATVGQYTGLSDKNSKEIYEKSTVHIYGEQELDFGFSFLWDEKAIVKWNEKEACFYLDVINKREVCLGEDCYFTVDTFVLREWEEGEWGIEYELLEG